VRQGEGGGRRIVGRDVELALIRDFVAAIREGPRVLLLEGLAGIGKTTLWHEGLRAAEAASCRVLSCRPAELESGHAFGALIDLLAPVAGDAVAQLPAPQRRALEVALLRADPGAVPPEPRDVAVATLGALRRVAASGPVLLAVDDLQWLDVASARVLSYAVRRLDRDPVGLLATARPDTAVPMEVERLRPEEELSQVTVSGLTLGALHQLIRDRLGVSLGRPDLVRLMQATGGNPFFALETVRSVERRQSSVEFDRSQPLPVPPSLHQLVAGRLRDLPDAAREAVLLAFALSHATPELVEAGLRLAGRSPEGLERALAAEALELRRGAVELTHPVIGSALYGALPPVARRQLHRRIARLAVQPEERARHLALAAAEPDAATAAQLEEAAGLARRRGAADAAAELLELAVRLTPDRELALRRTLALALDEHVSGEPERARERCRSVAEVAPPGPLRAAARWQMVQLRAVETVEEMDALLEQALAEAEDDVDLHAKIHTTWTRLAWWTARPRVAEPHASAALELAEHSDDGMTLATALCYAAVVDFCRGRGVRSSLLDRAIELERGFQSSVPVDAMPSFYRALLKTSERDDLDLARTYIGQVREAAVRRGDEEGLAVVAFQEAELECWAGRWQEAARLADEGLELASRVEAAHLYGLEVVTLAQLDAYRGDLETARKRALEVLAAEERTGYVITTARCRMVLGFVELTLGRHERVLEWLEPLRRAYRLGGFADPSALRFVGDLVESQVALGRTQEARRAFRSYAAVARRLGRRHGLAVAARCRALVLAAEGNLQAAVAPAEESVELSRSLGQPFELGRGLFVLGTIERRRRRKTSAARALGEAGDVFERLGSPHWAERTRRELARVGLRQRAPTTLTATERRVAELAARGHRNEEIARLASLSVKAVEANLTRVYRKLGVRSRHQLADRLAG